MNTYRTARGPRRAPRMSQRLAAFLRVYGSAGGLVVTGAAIAAAVTAALPGTATAGEVNYVRSASPDAYAGVRLDEEVVIRFATAVLPASVGPDTILVRTGVTNGEQARGEFEVGSFMYDRSTQRRVVIRPEAVREYYELIRNLPREDAERATAQLIRRVEQTGRFNVLRGIDQQLRAFFGPGYGAGTRLDDDGDDDGVGSVKAVYPAPLADSDNDQTDDPLTFNVGDDPLEPYRTRIAGDDRLWQDFVNGNVPNYVQLTANSEYERFYHPADPATLIPSATSVLRQREYRRVMINRRSKSRVMFVPELPIRADLADTGYQAGRPYAIIVPAFQPGVFNTVLTRDGRRPLLQKGGRDFSTLFTTLPLNSTQKLFLDSEAREGVAGAQYCRVINQTPPNGETFVDPTTDWEDPDDIWQTAEAARRTFTVRLRFAQPLDPRDVNPTNFLLTKVTSGVGTPSEQAQTIPIAVGTFLNQHRLGIVEVEVTPATNLDPLSRYQVAVSGRVKSLGGVNLLGTNGRGTDYVASFIVGPGEPPLDAIRENFDSAKNRASAADPDTLGQVTTAYWPAPELFDPDRTGKLVAAFMPFAGTAVGQFQDSRTTGAPTALNLSAGEAITFVTEGLDPGDVLSYQKQFEYHYTDVQLVSATASAIGRFPLVIRSQQTIQFSNSRISLRGQDGSPGLTNSDTVDGEPTGGLGGAPGSGGFRGGDGAFAPETDPTTDDPVVENGKFKFDQAKFNGSDGRPGFQVTGPGTGGGGSGGFSGDNDTPTVGGDPMLTPSHIREAGGGGGHATEGGFGAGSQISGETHPGGYFGGYGGPTYGSPTFSDQPLNADPYNVPTLGLGSGGAGGGGGGGEDDAPAAAVGDGLAGPEDSGGGGGGGGGGALLLVARDLVRINASVIDCSGGLGGRTFNASRSDFGQGAAGGCGAGGAIWMQCYNDGSLSTGIRIENGSTVTAGGGVPQGNSARGQWTQDASGTGALLGYGGIGGDGYVFFEDGDGSPTIIGSAVTGVVNQGVFRPKDDAGTPAIEEEFPSHPGVPFTVNRSVAYSRWFNSQLDTPTYFPHDDNTETAAVDGTKKFEPATGGTVEIFCRSTHNDTSNTGHPDLNLVTPWTRYDDVQTISDRRFLQFRVDFFLPLSHTFDQGLPYLDFLQIDIELD